MKLSSFRMFGLIAISSLCFTSSVFASSEQSTWTVDEALHLGRKTLFYVSPAQRDQLVSAGSVSAAVDILFPNQDGPLKTQYDSAISKLISTSGFVLEGSASNAWANRYYHTMLAADPYEAKAKLSLLWYDVFAVNKEGDIRMADIVDQQKLIYQYALGNYKTLIQRHLFNNSNPLGAGQGGRGDYAVGKFIDLLRQNVNFPNENYARELMQLFIMGEYDILENSETTTPNYTDADVVALAKKLTGLEDDPVTHQVTLNMSQHNTSTGVELLSGPLAAGYTPAMFPYWDETTNTMNLAAANVSINGNNGLMDNAINYVFAKREATIARYVAFLLYKYYVDDRVQHNNVTEANARANIQEVADQLIANKYEILPTLKWMLTRDFMYDNGTRTIPENKNPVELAIGTIKALNNHNSSGAFDINLMDGDLLVRLGWTPFYPGSIFGRDGFNNADIWINDYLINLWMSQSTSFPFFNYLSVGGGSAVWTGRFAILGSTGILDTIPTTPAEYVDGLENVFRGQSNVLKSSVKADIVNYLTSGGVLTFDPTNSGYVDTKMRGAIALLLSQPEYLLKQGMLASNVPESTAPSVIAGSHKIVFLELFGGYDRLYGVLPKDQYLRYITDRSLLAVPFAELHGLGDNLVNNTLRSLTELDANGELILINGVGAPGHSRGHDTAQRQSTSAFNEQKFGVEGIFGHLIKDDDPSNTYVIGLNKPNIFSQGKYTNIGPSSSQIRFVSSPWNVISEGERSSLVSAIKSTITNKPQTDYPGTIGKRYSAALTLDEIAGLPGPSTATRQLSGQLAYIKKLMDNGKGSAYYAVGGGGFDTHANQGDPTVLKNKMQSYASDIRNFFDNVKSSGQDVTIVVHTEFGRTIKRNGTNGTDHGEGGGYFIITNNSNMKSAFPAKSYGHIDLAKSKRDWLGIGIDYRAVYKRIYNALYNVVPSMVANFELDDEVDTTPPRFTLLHPEYKAQNNSSLSVVLSAKIVDVNYRPMNMASNLRAAWGTTGIAALVQENIRTLQKYIILDNEHVLYKKDRQPQLSTRWYGFTGMDNQHITTNITGYLSLPRIVSANNFVFSGSTDHIFRSFENTNVAGVVSLPTPISLSPDTYKLSGSDISLVVPTGTEVVSLDGNGLRNGGFLLPQVRAQQSFIHPNALYNGTTLDALTIDTIFQVGPDTLGVSALLNQDVMLRIPVVGTGLRDVITSNDGMTWTLLSGAILPVGGVVELNTTKLNMFAVVDTMMPSCEIVAHLGVGAYNYDITRKTKNTTDWTLTPSALQGTSLTGKTSVMVTPNQPYTYALAVSNATYGTTSACSVNFVHEELLSWTAPTCTLTSSKNAGGDYTLSRSFGGGQLPLSATLQGNQDVGDILNLAVTSKNTTPPANATTTYTLTTRGVNSEQTCTTTISTVVATAPTTPSYAGGGGGGLVMDVCPGGDLSTSYFDGKCKNDVLPIVENPKNNGIVKSGSITTIPYISQEKLIQWLYDNGFTKFNKKSDYRPANAITREQFAKMVVVADMIYNPTKKIVAGSCKFKDASEFDPTLKPFVISACERDLLIGYNNAFMPKRYVSYAHAVTVIERILHGRKVENNLRWMVYMNSAIKSNYLPYGRPKTAPSVYEPVSRITWGRLLYNTATINGIVSN